MNEDITNVKAEMTSNGPIMIKGKITIKNSDGKEDVYTNPFLCRCGGSSNKPFCDGTHKKNGFKG